MRTMVLLASWAVFSSLGCSGSDTKLNTAPLTEEQKQQIREQDQRIDEEERSGSGTASRPKGKQGTSRPNK